MKKSTLQLLKALFTGNNYHRLRAMKIAVLAVLLCGISNMAFAIVPVTINITTPTTIASGNECPGATNVNIYAFTLTGISGGATNTVTAVSFNINGVSTATVPGDIIQYKLWSGAGAGAGTLLATSTTNSFSGLSEVYINGTTNSYWVTMDVAAAPTTGHSLTLANMVSTNVTASGGAGSVTAGAISGANTQTIIAQPAVTSITATPTPLCQGATLTLTAIGSSGTITSYNWTGPNGYSSASAGNTKTYVVPAASASGVYSLTLSPNGTGCINNTVYTSAPVTVNATPTLPATGYICKGGSTTLNSGNATGTWTSSNTNVAVVGLTTGVVVSNIVGGVTTIVNMTTCGTASMVATVAVRPSRILGLANVCTGSSITLSSQTGGGVWSSSFTSIATVTGTAAGGVVTGAGIAPGSGATTIIYANSVTGCDTTTVISVNPTPFGITGPNVVCQGSTIQLADITDGISISTWSSSAVGTATVTLGPGVGGGIVTGIAGGLAQITYMVTNTGCYVTHSVTVNPQPAAISGTSPLCTGLTTTFSDATLGGTWISTVTGVATIDLNSGFAGGVQAGVTNIIYTRAVTGCSISFLLTVNQQPGPISGPDYVCAGNTITLSDAILGGTWTTANSSIAAVDSTSGVVTGQHAGPLAVTTNIIYDNPSCIAVQYTVTVNPAPGPITGVPNVCVGFTTSLSDTTVGGAWTNSDITIDTFTTAPTIRGITPGFSIITYTLPTTCYVTAPIIVYPNPDSIKGPDSVCQGAMVTLSDATAGGTWSSTVLAIARVVDSSGVVTGVSAGGVRISYTLSTGCYAVDTFTVKPPVVASVSISKNPPGITCAGSSITFTANPVNGGIPTYQWYKFVTPEGPLSTTPTYIDNPTTVGDVITVMMITHQSCAIHDTVFDSLAANVFPNAGVTVTISTSNSTDSAHFLGDQFTFFANVTYGGLTPHYQWYLNGSPIAGATNPSYSTPVYADGAYYCKVTGTPPCDAADTVGTSNSIFIYATYLLGVNPLALTTSDLVLFPNPTNGNIVLSGNVNTISNGDLDIEVSDMLGHLVYKGKTIPQNGSVREQISLDNLANGTYLLHVYSGSLNQVFHFVINK